MKNNKGTYEFESHASPLLRKVLALLAELKQTRNGAILYEHILLILEELDLTHSKIEYAYANFVSLLLEACASQLDEASPVLTHIKLAQTRLQPPISLIELSTLIQCVEIAADEIATSPDFNAERMSEALHPLLHQFLNATPANTQRAQRDIRIKVKKHRNDHHHAHDHQRNQDANPSRVELNTGSASGNNSISSASSGIKPLLVRDYEVDMDDKHEGGQLQGSGELSAQEQKNREDSQLLKDFVKQMRAAMNQSETCGVRLNAEIKALRQAENLEDVEARRQSVLKSLEILSNDHKRLSDEFAKVEEFLFLLESDHQELSNELHRVRMLSLTDELTSLPNRRAFMHRLEDEVSRVQRYGYPLAMVLLDIDHFKAINDKHGHVAGDAMLRVYADKVLSLFRHHDMVARYGGEEFAVLLPNTDMRGVLRAFSKIRKRVEETTCTINGTYIKIPTFSAGLAEYRAGETPSHLIERADSALYRAKRLGRNRIEVQPNEGHDESIQESLENESL